MFAGIRGGRRGGAPLSLGFLSPSSQPIKEAAFLKHRLASPPSNLAVAQSSTLRPRLKLSIYPPRRLRTAARSSNAANLPENHSPDGGALPSKEAVFDLKLPRRSMIVQFTCNACGERTQRTINRIAYERGTVFVQCAGCLVNHKLVDNLGLVVEYNLREEVDAETDGSKEG